LDQRKEFVGNYYGYGITAVYNHEENIIIDASRNTFL